MAQPESVDEAVEQAALTPKILRGPGGREIQQHGIADLIKAEQHAKAKEGATKPGGGIRLQEISPQYK